MGTALRSASSRNHRALRQISRQALHARGERYVTIATRSESLLALSPPSERLYPPRYQIHSPGLPPLETGHQAGGKRRVSCNFGQLNPKFRLDNSLISKAGRKPKSLRQQCRFPLQISATIGRYNASLCVAQSDWLSRLQSSFSPPSLSTIRLEKRQKLPRKHCEFNVIVRVK